MLTRIKKYYNENNEDIILSNQKTLRILSPLYLICLIIYFAVISMRQGICLESIAVIVGAAVHVLFLLFVFLYKKQPSFCLMNFALLFFGTTIIFLTGFLGTFADPKHSGVLFPLMLIMMTLFYIIPLYHIMPLIIFSAVVFLLVSYSIKEPELFALDALSTSVSFVIAVISAVTIQKGRLEAAERQSELDHLCRIDYLTGLYNKKAMYDNAEAMLKGLDADAEVAAAVLDIDKFKLINDKYGHVLGDSAIKSFSAALKKFFGNSKSRCVGRFGGDEFVILMVGHDLCSDMENRFDVLGCELKFDNVCDMTKLSFSAGAVVLKKENHDFTRILTEADKVLYDVKKGGGGTYAIKNKLPLD